MKPEQSERFLIEELFNKTQEKNILRDECLREVDKLTGDASTRRYYRITTDLKSYVVCLDNPSHEDPSVHPFLSVQKFLSQHKIKVPRILDFNLTKGYILQEDLGNQTLLSRLSIIESEQEELQIYKKIIDQLLTLHHIPCDCISNPHLFRLKFDLEKYMEEINFTLKYFFKIVSQYEDENLKENLISCFFPIVKRLASEKMVITHRDLHSRNVMVADESFFLIDFQDARLGIPQYDLVSLLEDCYYDLSSSSREWLKHYYFQNLKKVIHGQKNFDHFLELYDDMLIQRVFKAIGSFCYIYETRKDYRYVKYIGFAMEKMRKVMIGKPRYKNLQNHLFKYYYAN